MRSWSTVDAMDRLSSLARRYGLDVLIVLAAVEGVVEIALGTMRRARREPAWFAVPAVAVVVLPLLARRRFPFAAPAAVWLLAVALVRRRPADRVHVRRLRRRHGRRVPARQPPRRRPGAHRSGRRARLRGDRRLQRPDPHAGGLRLHPAVLRDRLARRLRPARAGRAGRGGGGSARPRPSASARRPPASPWPRSARGSRASCTTSSPTRSA